jgi:hypothetical protein
MLKNVLIVLGATCALAVLRPPLTFAKTPAQAIENRRWRIAKYRGDSTQKGDEQGLVDAAKTAEITFSLRIRHIQGIFLAATLAWTPLMIVTLEGFWGLDAYRLFGTAFLVSNLLVGLAIIPLALWLSKRFSDRMGRSPFLQRLMKDLAGYNLNAAAGFLAKLSQFEDENLAK